MRTDTDVVVVGGGPGGSIAARSLIDRGLRPVIVEQQRFPRYHVGESMTGEAGGILRSLGFEPQMQARRFPVKHGVSVYGPKGRPDWFVPVMARSEAGLEDQTTWQVRRSEFDAMLLDSACERGAELVSGRATQPLMDETGRIVGVSVDRPGRPPLDIHARYTLDCSGQASFLAGCGATGQKYLGAYDKQIAIFAQLTGYERGDGSARETQPGNTDIFYREKYRWAWAIPLDDDVVSIGVVCPARYFTETGESKDDFLLREIRELNPGLAARFAEARLVEPARAIRNYSYQVRDFAGPGYVCVGDSHRFIDPIFSFGLFISMWEGQYAAGFAASQLQDGPATDKRFREYQVGVERSLDLLEDTIDAFWENPLAFAVLSHRKHKVGLIDIFAGRIFEGHPSDGVPAAMGSFRRLLKRERGYGAEDLFSVPIGSRYHAERAPLWNSELKTVEMVEDWMA